MRIMAIVMIYSIVYNWENDQAGNGEIGGNQDDSGHEWG